MTEVDLDELLEEVADSVSTELSCKPEVIDVGHDLDLAKLPIVARKWHRLSDGVAVVADLKGSTQMGIKKHSASTASIYEASTGNVVRILNEFDADYIAIQGDGAFGMFWGDNRRERAICAGITIKTFSQWTLTPKLEKKWDTLPATGLKVGIASSALLVKKVGVPRSIYQEPVWAGKAVNYAAKAAQQVDRHEMLVTGSIWAKLLNNDYLAFSCPCGDGPSPTIWDDVTIEKIPEGQVDREGKRLSSTWCAIHGAEFCAAILAGKKRRDDTAGLRAAANRVEMTKSLRWKAHEAYEQKRNLSQLYR
ncbi:hypothetical protein [Nonomuraea cavernae]|uniref:Guanylate cyclase domain-containing protein n=1 Tax=Nonomuraea cavernae TaxID=2045107 RepID=A0A917Z1J2_9ACTN|nr:hypothetical protein [Nonomuraea cavernae]MCA2186036.1 hypothetical protein [Nonomuraea cavernae]GGO70418.1 hypothetical protein GCM10012289_33820 [Nonomuraea cavernae]